MVRKRNKGVYILLGVVMLCCFLSIGVGSFFYFDDAREVSGDQPVFVEIASDLKAGHWKETISMLGMFGDDNVILIKEGENPYGH